MKLDHEVACLRRAVAHLIALACLTMSVAQSAEDQKKPDAKGEQKPEAKANAPASATPWPRRIFLPTLVLEDVPGWTAPGATRRALSADARFTIVAVLASWNPASSPLAAWLTSVAVSLSARRVRVVGAFSNDTAPSVLRFLTRERPRFEAGLAPAEFLKELGNPKVPTVWVVNPRGEIVTRKELPNETEMKRIAEDLARWTDF